MLTYHLIDEMNLHQEELLKQGFTILSNQFDPLFIQSHLQLIQQKIKQHAQTLQSNQEDYLTAVSRWLIHTQDLRFEIIHQKLHQILKELVNANILVKSNLISKNQFANGKLALHQDISYSPQNPYEYSAWLALTDSPLESGTLCVVPGSHLGEIEAAVDFWSPFFKEKKINIEKKSLAVHAGDLIIFDSRLWHGSDPNFIKHERFALVTRWKSDTYIPPKIPPIKPLDFGMWQCQNQAQAILKYAIKFSFDIDSNDFLDLLGLWKRYFQKGFLPKDNQNIKAIQSIELVEILHRAHQDHQGGDAQGVIYFNLWHQCLMPIQDHLKIDIFSLLSHQNQ